jgi:hypothetical protein
MITNARLEQWLQWARRDDAFNYFVPSDLREMIGEIKRLREKAGHVEVGPEVLDDLAMAIHRLLPGSFSTLVEAPLRADGIWVSGNWLRAETRHCRVVAEAGIYVVRR